MKITKILCLILSLVMLCGLFTACGKAEPEAAPEEAQAEVKEEPLTPFEECAKFAVSKVKDSLINPGSMSVNHIYGVEDKANEAYFILVDYSAQTAGGGVGRSEEYFWLKCSIDGDSVSYTELGADKTTIQVNYTMKALEGYFEFDTETYRQTVEHTTGN